MKAGLDSIASCKNFSSAPYHRRGEVPFRSIGDTNGRTSRYATIDMDHQALARPGRDRLEGGLGEVHFPAARMIGEETG